MLEYCIQDHTGASAVILPEKGATVISYCVGGQEFFYRDDANLASSERPRCGIPFLFPVFGRTPEGSPYPMQIHGFGHTSSWTVVESSESSLTLALLPNEDTRKGYPFQFRVQLTFSRAVSVAAVNIWQMVDTADCGPLANAVVQYWADGAWENVTNQVNPDAFADDLNVVTFDEVLINTECLFSVNTIDDTNESSNV